MEVEEHLPDPLTVGKLEAAIRTLRRAADTGRYDDALSSAKEVRLLAGEAGSLAASLAQMVAEIEKLGQEGFLQQGIVVAARLQLLFQGLKTKVVKKPPRAFRRFRTRNFSRVLAPVLTIFNFSSYWNQ